MRSSYSSQDVTMLIKDLTGIVTPVSLEEKDRRVAAGEFERSIMIEEYPMDETYESIITSSFNRYVPYTAIAVMSLAEQLYRAKGKDLVLVSIIRAGIPIGILIKRYLKIKYHIDVAHYAVSLVKGLDDNAMKYILSHHAPETIQFIDGWTGKGTVTNELVESAKHYPGVDASLAVLSDVTGLAKYAGIRRDFCVPSAPMNACATGLVSITIFNTPLVGPNDYHGAMYLEHLRGHDHSIEFIDTITMYLKVRWKDLERVCMGMDISNRGIQLECPVVASALNKDMKKLNPGINEAARAILRRNLEELLVVSESDPEVQMIMELAKSKGVPIREYPLKTYKAISVAK